MCISNLLKHQHHSHQDEERTKRAVAVWVVAHVVSHIILEPQQLWFCAMIFSISMNFVYPMASLVRMGRYRLLLEVAVAVTLIGLSVQGYVQEKPIILISAIALHGVWDGIKHILSVGIPFFQWYTLSCLAYDWMWAFYLYYCYL